MIVNQPVPEDLPNTPAVQDPEWYRRAVFYVVLVSSFQDSNGDGIGDLKGVTAKLDYLQWLGIDCLLLSPVFPSPWRDGGYDVSDYTGVHPALGDLADVVELVDAAHQRGIRVCLDVALTHTSDQHPWFEESSTDPDGPYGDYYNWYDDDGQDRVFSPSRRQYYAHGRHTHEPSLNLENPAVHEKLVSALRFWLGLGLDAVRVTSLPRSGDEYRLARCHLLLRTIRSVIDAEHHGAVLLAEADEWLPDLARYFGAPAEGERECHMVCHQPLAPQAFLSIRQESRHPVSETLATTPTIPPDCQWGLFLRNRDELALDRLTHEERAYLYAEYAPDPRMTDGLTGIRRRLAPLLQSDPKQVQLLTSLLLSLPGSPILYYGDEIGMGDNIWLGDRDAVRTPMQWAADRNAGFSSCDPRQLFLPVVADPLHGWRATSVEAQMSLPTSLLHGLGRLIDLRRRHPAFALGSYTEVDSSNPSVLAYVREHGSDMILCVVNFSRFFQPVDLDLRHLIGRSPFELTGGVRFPAVGELPYLLTLGGHGFYWIQLRAS
ncbi:alpha-amylase family glycosyl hydrolase [Streptomyces sp. S.PNR 29]|uniref:alpha-amylase family glycosyl hydrolase n=1 Tax=Streptomyces sp. S.PNR 29 TaxID=2973805 RepID=UPI0025B0662B|nr:alpha-amylase family glycosyl hydrolase [Streptomyces sp. S.PNR 29]MDN0196556.1 alpha-amylase family glycosyl hydrolase [Streptomyces sp. S.PNR 29]